MAEFLEQEIMYFTPTTAGPSPTKLSGQRYEELDMDGVHITPGARPRHPQARGCSTMGETVDGNYVVLGERPPTQ